MDDVGCAPGYTLERHGRVFELQLTRPELRNRIDHDLHEALHGVFGTLAAESDARALVFSATGPAFSAGGDFDFILAQNRSADRTSTIQRGMDLIWRYLEIPIPIVVALHGDVMGLGASLVLASDVVVAHPGVRIADPHVMVGLVAGDGGTLVWPASAGMLVAKRHLLTGEPLTGEDAHRLGLVTDLVDDADQVRTRAMDLAQRIAALPPLAVQGTKRALNSILRKRFAEVMEMSAVLEVESLMSADVREAIASMRERRPASYEGR